MINGKTIAKTGFMGLPRASVIIERARAQLSRELDGIPTGSGPDAKALE